MVYTRKSNEVLKLACSINILYTKDTPILCCNKPQIMTVLEALFYSCGYLLVIIHNLWSICSLITQIMFIIS